MIRGVSTLFFVAKFKALSLYFSTPLKSPLKTFLKVLEGLKKRRNAEYNLFNYGFNKEEE